MRSVLYFLSFGVADDDPRSTVAGGKVSQFGADSAGLNPAWRDAVVETVCGFGWEEDTPSTDIRVMIDQLRGWIQAMYDVSPNDGAYFNEVSALLHSPNENVVH